MLWLWITLGILGATLVFILISSVAMFRVFLIKPRFTEKNLPLSKQDKERFFSENAKAVEWFEKLNQEEVYITSGQIKLHGIFLNQNSDRTVILVHGYSAKLKYRIQDAPFYYNSGFNVLLIDLRSHGNSGGRYVTVGKHESSDLLMWISWLNERTNNSKIVLDGVSMGAATVLCATALELPSNVLFAVSDCAYTTMRDCIGSLMNRSLFFLGWLVIGLGELYSRRWGKFSLSKEGPIDCVQKAKIPILFIHGEKDWFIPPYMVDKLYTKCASKKVVLKIPKAGHAMSFVYDRERCNKEITKFIKKTMGTNAKTSDTKIEQKNSEKTSSSQGKKMVEKIKLDSNKEVKQKTSKKVVEKPKK